MFLAAFFLLSFIFFNIFISSIGFIFKMSIHESFFMISLILSILLNLFFLKKNNLLSDNKDSNDKFQKDNKFIHMKKNKNINININALKNIGVSIILPIIIIFSSLWINGKVYDYTWDGNSYQKATTGMLAIGWNPLYEELEEFDKNNKFHINIGDESPVYINNYAKGSNIFAANMYKFTGNIETGKALNTIVIVMLFLFNFSFLLYKKKGILFALAFSICAVTYPVICTQFLTNYIDLLVYVFLYLAIFAFFLFEENLDFDNSGDIEKQNNRENFIFNNCDIFILFFMVLTIAINVKFSLFAYVGLFCLAYYIWYAYRFFKHKLDKKFFVEFTATAIVSVLVGVFVMGLSVYPKNLIDHGNPFYPLFGEEKVDIMTVNQPKEFKDKLPLQNFVVSLFARVDDIIETTDRDVKLKIPFTIYEHEISNSGLPDARLAGNGVFFSGIFLISIVVIVFLAKDLYNKDSRRCILFFIPIGVTIVMAVFLGEAWWARYFPQLYIFILFAIVLLQESDKTKLLKVLKWGFICILLINNFISFTSALKKSYHNNVTYNMEFQKYESLNIPSEAILTVYTNSFNGAKFDILDKTKNKNVIFVNQYPEDKTNINTFFGGKIEWRYDYEEVH